MDKGDMGWEGRGGILRYRSFGEAHYLITCIVEEVGETCSQILSPCPGDIVDYGTGLSSARLHRLAGLYDSPMPESTISPSQGLRIWLQLSPSTRYLRQQGYAQQYVHTVKNARKI